MLSTHRSGTEHSISLRPKSKIATKVFLVCTLGVIAFSLLSVRVQPVHASGTPLQLGMVGTQTTLTSCPGSGWYSYTNSQGQTTPMTCIATSITKCPNAQDLGLTFGYIYPIAPYKGTIVFLSSGDGTMPSTAEDQEQAFGDYYYPQGYEIVQAKWDDAWQQTDVPSQTNSPYPASVQYAACRPATFLNFVHQYYYNNNSNPNLNAGMCVQGTSAGSAAAAYSLAYYGASSYIDAAELLSGPVLSDMEQGCEQPPPPQNTLVCGQNNGSQIGCKLGGLAPWLNGPEYTGAKSAIRNWTGDPSCGNPNGTSSTSNAAWLQMSIVDGGPNSPTFSYPTTAMTAWLCQSVANSQNLDCSQSQNFNYCPNNSSSQGQIFYQAITANGVTPTAPYTIYAVENCPTSEGVATTSTTVPGYLNDSGGFNDIKYDMAGKPPNQPAMCVHPQ